MSCTRSLLHHEIKLASAEARPDHVLPCRGGMGPVIRLATVSLNATPCWRKVGCTWCLLRRTSVLIPSRNLVFGGVVPVVACFGGLEVTHLAGRAQRSCIVDSGGTERWGCAAVLGVRGSRGILLEALCSEGRRNCS